MGEQDDRITHVSDVRRVNKQLEYVLEYVVERKRVDDLAASIRDQRFRKQKAAMTRCGARCLLYLIEGLPESARYTLCRITFLKPTLRAAITWRQAEGTTRPYGVASFHRATLPAIPHRESPRQRSLYPTPLLMPFKLSVQAVIPDLES